MNHQDEPGTAAAEECGDLEYDLAHEAATIDADCGAEAPDEDADEPTQVGTRTEGYDGDYGYDLVHDLARPDRPPGHRRH